MKKSYKFLTLLLLVIIILSGCNEPDPVTKSTDVNISDRFKLVEDLGKTVFGESTVIIKDTKTQCQYIKSSSDTGYEGYGYSVPYVGEDGKVVGCGEDEVNISEEELEVIKEKYNLEEKSK